MATPSTPHILVAPLNWGLGHATRSSVIVRQLLRMGVRVTLASDGVAAALLQREFPNVEHLQLPGYHIKYSRRLLTAHLLGQLPRICRSIAAEHWHTTRWVSSLQIHGIISDNRYGVWSRKVPSVIVTHQVRLPLGTNRAATLFGEALHRPWLLPFDQCWVPDVADPATALSGLLSHRLLAPPAGLQYIGWLSRLLPCSEPITPRYAIGAVLSGLEPLRTDFERALYAQLTALRLPTLLIRGIAPGSTVAPLPDLPHLSVLPFATASELQTLLPQCQMLIMRSGYSSLMDTAPLGIPTLLVPTPGQAEQQYLAHHLTRQNRYLAQAQHRLSVSEALNQLSAQTTTHSPSSPDLLTPVLQSWLQSLRRS